MEEANNAMTNQQLDLLGLRVCYLLPNRHWRDFSLPTNRRGHGVFVPRFSGWYERDLTLLFLGGADWGPLSGALRVGRELTLVFVGGSNRGPLGGSLQVITPPSPFCHNPYYMAFCITKVLVIFVILGGGNKFLVIILSIDIIPVVIPVPSCRGCCRSSLSGPWQHGVL